MTDPLSLLFQLVILPLPWGLRRRLLNRVFGYRIDQSARIGLSIVAPRHLTMGPRSTIGHLNVIRGMEAITLDEQSIISHLNWIYGIPTDMMGGDRRSELYLGEGAGITRRHLIDCSDRVVLEPFSLIAGYNTQVLTHAIDLAQGRQTTKPITIGRYGMVGSRSILLGGARLPAYSALGAGSTLRESFESTHTIYSGVPAKPAGGIREDAEFFHRSAARALL